MEVQISHHAKSRLKQRCGLKKQSFARTVEHVLLEGMKHEDASGRLKKYLDFLWFSHKNSNNTRIYGETVYLFRNSKLITVIPLPKEYRGAVKKFFSKKEN